MAVSFKGTDRIFLLFEVDAETVSILCSRSTSAHFSFRISPMRMPVLAANSKIRATVRFFQVLKAVSNASVHPG